ncbi:MAG: hypothetical protein KGH98_04455 [Candidatus Micrarchaeota archaeon]|nr:hypothetical protein [Candidatus Micrarchaeota archaeon]
MMDKRLVEFNAKVIASETVKTIKDIVRGAQSVTHEPAVVLSNEIGGNSMAMDYGRRAIMFDQARFVAEPELIPVVVSRAAARYVYGAEILTKEYRESRMGAVYPPMTALDAQIYVSITESFSNFVSGYWRSPDRRGLGRKDRIVKNMFAEFRSLEGLDYYLNGLERYITRKGPEVGVMVGPDMSVNRKVLGSAVATIVYERAGFDPVRTINVLFDQPQGVLDFIREDSEAKIR